jgi:hypothetical protein
MNNNVEIDHKVTRLISLGYNRNDIQQILKCDQGAVSRSFLRLAKVQTKLTNSAARHELDKSTRLSKSFSQKTNRNQELTTQDRSTGVPVTTRNRSNSTGPLSATDSPGALVAGGVKINRNQLPANLPIDLEQKDLSDRITQILESTANAVLANKNIQQNAMQKAIIQLQKSAQPTDLIPIKKTLDSIQARITAATSLQEARAFTGYVLDKCDHSIRSQVAKVMSAVGLQACIPERLSYLYEHVVVD